MTKTLSPLDAVFLQIESPTMLGHVGGLQIFSLPKEAPATFLDDLVARLRAPRALASPWNLKLQRSLFPALRPKLAVDHDVDLDYHVRHLALPAPGGERELGMLVSRLHSHPLSRRRPLWECHVIEGLENGRFAIYIKIHHAIADGVTAMRLVTQSLGDNPATTAVAPWAFTCAPSAGTMKPPASRIRVARELAVAALEVGRAALDSENTLALPFTAPQSVFNATIGPQRRLATQQFDLARIKRLARAANATLNDVVLAMSGTALRRFLKESGVLPSKALITGVPVSIRPASDVSGGNAVTMMLATLATDVADPRTRLETIRGSTARGKLHLQAMSPSALKAYTGLLLAPFVGQMLSGFAARARPFFNVPVSNVPGPEQRLFLGGARLEAMYPVSNVFDGQALNITCVSYAGTLNFGFTGCRDSLPGMQRLALYLADALPELEAAFGIDHPKLARAA